jgi:hypothetical protein
MTVIARVRKHRQLAAKAGLRRVEVQVPAEDTRLIRRLAKSLRDNDDFSDVLRLEKRSWRIPKPGDPGSALFAMKDDPDWEGGFEIPDRDARFRRSPFE